VREFDMPLKVKLDNKEQWIKPTSNWTHEYTNTIKKELSIEPSFFAAGFRNIN